MNVSMDSCATLGLLLIAISVGLTNCQNVPCNSSQPHIRGLCGSRLARAHSNLCFILRNQFPDIFSKSKRSTGNNLMDELDRISAFSLAGMDSGPGIWTREKYEKKFLDERQGSEEAERLFPDRTNDQADVRILDDLIRAVKRRVPSRRWKRQSGHSDIICECCFNECSVPQLATYC